MGNRMVSSVSMFVVVFNVCFDGNEVEWVDISVVVGCGWWVMDLVVIVMIVLSGK